MKVTKSLLIAASILFPSLSQAAPQCKVDHAEYVMTGRPDITAGFRAIPHLKGWVSDVALYVDFHRTGQRYWFLFDQGSSHYITLISTDNVNAPSWSPPSADGGHRPLGSMTYWSSKDGLTYPLVVPKNDQEADKIILLPDLSEIMWYRASPRVDVPTSAFMLRKCRAS